MQILPLIIGCTAAAGCLIGACICLRRKRYIDDLPTSKTQGVFIGLTELKGSAESESPLKSYLGGIDCVWYLWKVEEHWSRTVTYVDKDGTHTRTESGWKEVAAGGESPPFYLKDDTGVILIQPKGANIHATTSFSRRCGRSDPLYYGKGPRKNVADTTHIRRFHESALPLHTQLYIMGQARERRDAVAAEIARDKASPMFIISTKSEKRLSGDYTIWIWVWCLLGLLCAAAGAYFTRITNFAHVLPEQFVIQGEFFPGNAPLEWKPFAIAGAVYLAVLTLGWTWTVYNSLVTMRNRVNQARSQINIQLKRRADLIPGLVACVDGYRKHETDVQQLITGLRAMAQTARENEIHGYSTELAAVAERHPELKANRSFLALQNSLSDTESRIALAHSYFNDIATFYNTRLGIIPDRFVGWLGRLSPQALLQASELERQPVKVKLAP